VLERLVLWLFLEMGRRRRKGRFFEFGCEGQENCYDDKWRGGRTLVWKK
jgi:hypothetical protein